MIEEKCAEKSKSRASTQDYRRIEIYGLIEYAQFN